MKTKHKFNRLISCLLVLLIIVGIVPVMGVSASYGTEEFVTSEGLVYEIIDGEVYITDNRTGLAEVTVPSTINGYPVTTIGFAAFSEAYSDHILTKVTLPESITTIDSGAFGSCDLLSEVNIPSSVTRIGERIFDENAYYNNTDNWDNGVLYLDNALIAVDGEGVGNTCEIKAGTRIIADEAFAGCRDLKNISLPDGLKHIGYKAFSNCWALTTVEIPGTVKVIKENTFEYCKNLGEIILNEGLESIEREALFKCAPLVSLDIPASVKSIDSKGIWDCKGLKTINVNAGNENYYDIDGVLFSKEDKSLVRYPEGKENSAYTVPGGTLKIAENAFSTYYSWDGWEYDSCQNLESVVIPDSVTTIGEDAFARCTSLKSVYIGDNVSEIKQGAFCDCFALEDVVLPEGITKIATATFVNCENLKEIKIPSGVKEVERQAFGGCEILTTVEIPEGVTKIVDAFLGCYALKSVILPKSITDISGAFSFCSELTDIYYADTQEAWNKVEGAASESLANVTIHFNYGVSTEPEPTEPTATMPSDEPVTGGYALGDSNEDGKVNVKDATQIQKAVAGLITLSMVGRNMADVDSNGKVNVKDATAIQKWVAGIETGFEIGK